MAKVYCLIRTKQGAAATTRLEDVLTRNHLLKDATAMQLDKIFAMHYDLGSSDKMGLSKEDYEALRSVTLVIHNAWAVNFNMDLRDFEQHIRGTSELLKLATQSKLVQKPDFVFISTFAAIARASPIPIPEQLYDIEVASGTTNYGLSKWTAEQLCSGATKKAGLRVRVLRLSQMCGDTRYGMWNPKEAWPQVMASAVTIRGLPAPEHGDDKHSWLPTDVAGAVIADLALLDQIDDDTRASLRPLSVLHVANPKYVLWKGEVLPALQRNGLEFDTLGWQEWVARLERSDPNVLRNPPRRLLDFYKVLAVQRRSLHMDISNAIKCSPRLAEGATIDEALIGRFVKFWRTAKGWAGQASTSL